MNKFRSLIKATMTQDMSIFKVKSKSKYVPIFLLGVILVMMWGYANMIMEPLHPIHMEFVGITIFIFFTTAITLIEGIYKTSSLLFNAKDDSLLLSLPIKKETVLFIRILKFYLFELVYNSMLLIPVFIAYVRWVKVGFSFYLLALLATILLPMIPVAISSLIGMIISNSSSKFKSKKVVQSILTIIFTLGIMFLSFNLETYLSKIAENAHSINDIITKLYLPAGLFINLITSFKFMDLVKFILIHILVFGIVVFIMSKRYFKVNSDVKSVESRKNKKDYKISCSTPIGAIIKKELNRFINSPVFITNAGFGLVLFLIGTIAFCFKSDSLIKTLIAINLFNVKDIKSFVSILLFAFVILSSFMTSITSSMISLEGKSFNILKSLPVDVPTIIKGKVLTAVLFMIPFLIIGDLAIFIKFNLEIIDMILILITSILLPLISEYIGIIVNLNFPRMEWTNDTEVVKQSMSSLISTSIGMILSFISVYVIIKLFSNNISNILIMVLMLTIFVIIYFSLIIYIKRVGYKKFKEINV